MWKALRRLMRCNRTPSTEPVRRARLQVEILERRDLPSAVAADILPALYNLPNNLAGVAALMGSSSPSTQQTSSGSLSASLKATTAPTGTTYKVQFQGNFAFAGFQLAVSLAVTSAPNTETAVEGSFQIVVFHAPTKTDSQIEPLSFTGGFRVTVSANDTKPAPLTRTVSDSASSVQPLGNASFTFGQPSFTNAIQRGSNTYQQIAFGTQPANRNQPQIIGGESSIPDGSFSRTGGFSVTGTEDLTSTIGGSAALGHSDFRASRTSPETGSITTSHPVTASEPLQAPGIAASEPGEPEPTRNRNDADAATEPPSPDPADGYAANGSMVFSFLLGFAIADPVAAVGDDREPAKPLFVTRWSLVWPPNR